MDKNAFHPAAYTTWLFGVLFHVVGAPLSAQVLASSIEVQAQMLRILSRLNLLMFESISEEYMNILDGKFSKMEIFFFPFLAFFFFFISMYKLGNVFTAKFCN